MQPCRESNRGDKLLVKPEAFRNERGVLTDPDGVVGSVAVAELAVPVLRFVRRARGGGNGERGGCEREV